MASLVMCISSIINKVVGTRLSHSTTVLHHLLDSSELKKYEEVFVIGDVHGCYDELLMLMKEANVEKDRTLKIFVGDIVNKGPKNVEVLNFIRRNPTMLAVRGNHDEVVLREYFKSKEKDSVLKPQNLWIKDLTQEEIDYLQNLPYTLSLPSLNAVVVHAGLLPGKPLEDNCPYNMVHMRNIIETDYFWDGGFKASENAKEGQPWASVWGGPQHVYFGHDAKRMLQIYPYATGLDTGCVYGNYLTGVFISGPRNGLFVKVKAVKTHSKPKG